MTKQERLEHNRVTSAAILRAAGIPFKSFNKGARLCVAKKIDFWPGSGLWIDTRIGTRHIGIRKLIAYLKK